MNSTCTHWIWNKFNWRFFKISVCLLIWMIPRTIDLNYKNNPVIHGSLAIEHFRNDKPRSTYVISPFNINIFSPNNQEINEIVFQQITIIYSVHIDLIYWQPCRDAGPLVSESEQRGYVSLTPVSKDNFTFGRSLICRTRR